MNDNTDCSLAEGFSLWEKLYAQVTFFTTSIDSGGWISSWYKYIVNVAGIQFYCNTSQKVDILERMHVIAADKISVPE